MNIHTNVNSKTCVTASCLEKCSRRESLGRVVVTGEAAAILEILEAADTDPVQFDHKHVLGMLECGVDIK